MGKKKKNDNEVKRLYNLMIEGLIELENTIRSYDKKDFKKALRKEYFMMPWHTDAYREIDLDYAVDKIQENFGDIVYIATVDGEGCRYSFYHPLACFFKIGFKGVEDISEIEKCKFHLEIE